MSDVTARPTNVPPSSPASSVAVRAPQAGDRDRERSARPGRPAGRDAAGLHPNVRGDRRGSLT